MNDTLPKSAKKRPQPKGGSRKGIPNKVTKELKDMIRGALDQAGGQAYLARQAVENPSAFLTLLGKTLPKELTGADGGPIQHDIAGIQLIPLSAATD